MEGSFKKIVFEVSNFHESFKKYFLPSWHIIIFYISAYKSLKTFSYFKALWFKLLILILYGGGSGRCWIFSEFHSFYRWWKLRWKAMIIKASHNPIAKRQENSKNTNFKILFQLRQLQWLLALNVMAPNWPCHLFVSWSYSTSWGFNFISFTSPLAGP